MRRDVSEVLGTEVDFGPDPAASPSTMSITCGPNPRTDYSTVPSQEQPQTTTPREGVGGVGVSGDGRSSGLGELGGTCLEPSENPWCSTGERERGVWG